MQINSQKTYIIPRIDPVEYNTDIYGSWNIGQLKIKTENEKEAFNFAFKHQAYVLVKPSRGKYWYIKGINNNKSYIEIELHVKNNEINNYKPNSKTWLINYTETIM